MFFFWRNKERPVEPQLEAVPTWNHLSRIQGLGSKANLSDILIVFNRFAKLPFFGSPQHLMLDVSEGSVVLKRCFGPDKGCFTLRLALPVTQSVHLSLPQTERRTFMKQVNGLTQIQQVKRVPIEALTIHYES